CSNIIRPTTVPRSMPSPHCRRHYASKIPLQPRENLQPVSVMLQRFLKPFRVVPAFVESLEDVAELILGQAVEVSHNRIEFVNHVLPLVIFELATLDANGLGPLAIAIVPRRKPPGQDHNSLPKGIVSARAWDGKRIQDVVVHADLDEAPGIPVGRKRT